MSYGKFYAVEVVRRWESGYKPIKAYYIFDPDSIVEEGINGNYLAGEKPNVCNLTTSHIIADSATQEAQSDPKNMSAWILMLELVRFRQPAESKENDPLNRAIDEIRKK
jgi:hypothetical protein